MNLFSHFFQSLLFMYHPWLNDRTLWMTMNDSLHKKQIMRIYNVHCAIFKKPDTQLIRDLPPPTLVTKLERDTWGPISSTLAHEGKLLSPSFLWYETLGLVFLIIDANKFSLWKKQQRMSLDQLWKRLFLSKPKASFYPVLLRVTWRCGPGTCIKYNIRPTNSKKGSNWRSETSEFWECRTKHTAYHWKGNSKGEKSKSLSLLIMPPVTILSQLLVTMRR